MSKYIAESFYTCLFKITHNLQELTNEALQENKTGTEDAYNPNKYKPQSKADYESWRP